MKYFFISYFLVAATIVCFAGFRGHTFEQTPFQLFPDMDDQAKVKYQVESHFFANGHSMQLPVKGTMPMGYQVPAKPVNEGIVVQDIEFTHGTGYLYTGKFGDFFGDGFPDELPVTPELIKRGQERFNINCAVCHGLSGNGKGIVTKYTTVMPTDLVGGGFDDPAGPAYRPDGKIFEVITHGWNQMGGYGANITIKDRWAIVAYVRTLQHAAKNPATK